MKNRWKILCGIVTMSTLLVSAGCFNIGNGLKEAKEAVEVEDAGEEEIEVVPADLAVIN